MDNSIISIQKKTILDTLLRISGQQWNALVLDQQSKKLVDNVTKEDDILKCDIINVQILEEHRVMQEDTDAIYLLCPLPDVVEYLKADLSRRTYKSAYLIWTSTPSEKLESNLLASRSRSQQIRGSKVLNIDFYPREAQLVTFREHWSFQILYNPTCDGLVASYINSLAEKIVSLCMSLGEVPLVRCYRPRNRTYRAHVLSAHIAKTVSDILRPYEEEMRAREARDARGRGDATQGNKPPRAVLFITDRSMDLMAPLMHELTYQAMALDLLPIQETNDVMTYRNVIRRGRPDQEEKDIPITEQDQIWVRTRHLHMKDLLIKLSNDFKDFQAKNSHFNTGEDAPPISINLIKDMMADMPEFQKGKEEYSLHIDMAEKCAKYFQEYKLMDVTSVEQSLAIGLDEDNRPPKNLADQLIRLLDDDSVTHEHRARLLVLYILYRKGILGGDIEKLRRHGQLSEMDRETIYNLAALGASVQKELSDLRAPEKHEPPLFEPVKVTYAPGEEVSLSRFETNVKYMLEAQCNGTLDNEIFPYLNRSAQDEALAVREQQQQSLRAAQPTWAKSRSTTGKSRQRYIVFIAGGATYSEARACYEISQQKQKEVYLATTQMLTPKMFYRQLHLLSAPRNQLKLPMDKRPVQLPAWISQPPASAAAQQQPAQPRQPSDRRGQASYNNSAPQGSLDPRRDPRAEHRTPSRGASPARPGPTTVDHRPQSQADGESSSKLKKDKKEKKGHGFGIFGKKH